MINRKVNAASDTLVGSDVAESLAVEYRGAGSDLYTDYPRLEPKCRQTQNQQQ